MEWSINVRCEPRAVTALDGAISAAYPDVRLGRIHGEQPRPRQGGFREPRCLMRFCNERSFVYSLIADGEEQASSPIEQIARAQIAQGQPSVVRFQLTPTPVSFEGLVRRLYRRNEQLASPFMPPAPAALNPPTGPQDTTRRGDPGRLFRDGGGGATRSRRAAHNPSDANA